MQQIITRFAPSPTGYLHIGSARTALFSFLYARANGGKFFLRVEDTDRARSTNEAVEAILHGLNWLDLKWDGEVVHQFSRAERHAKVALELLQLGKAYKCFHTPEELEILRAESMLSGKPIISKWRDVEPAKHPEQPYVIRIKAPRAGVTIIEDKVQGKVVTENQTLDDMVLLRSDGTPTYMLAVVVDDHDMGVTHVIRGDDHLSNTPRQVMIYQGMGWDLPIYAHIPLIHGEDGKKLSKRHGALGVDAYQAMGYLPEALCNYLLRLGWSHGDDEIINQEQAIAWFNLESIGKSPSRLDFKKLDNVNNHYLKTADNQRLLNLIAEQSWGDASRQNILSGLDSLKQRAKTIVELKEAAKIYVSESNIEIPADLRVQVLNNKALIAEFKQQLLQTTNWQKDELMAAAKEFAETKQMKLGDLAAIIRIILTGSNASPSVFEIMAVLGREASLQRISDAYNS